MPETGSNNQEQNKDLSTELSLSGLSFYDRQVRKCSPEEVAEFVTRTFGSCRKNHLYIYGVEDSTVYIVCLKEDVLFAEPMPCASADDALYYCSVMNSDFEISKNVIVVGGVGAQANIKLLKRYFKQVVDANNQR